MRRVLHLGSQYPLTFDGSQAECWFIAMRSNVNEATIKNLTPGRLYTVTLRQNGVGGFAFAWPDGFINPAPAYSKPNSTMIQNFIAITPTQLAAITPGTWI